MTQKIDKTPSYTGVLGIISPFFIIVVAWGINVNVRLKSLEIELDNLKEKSERTEQVLEEINKSLYTISINVNTLMVKYDMVKNDNQKTNKDEKIN